MYLDEVKDIIKNNKYYEDLYDIVWKLGEGKKIEKKNYNGIKIGLFNTPCAGFGDIIVCKTFYDYLKEWYPSASVTICTTAPAKYNDLGIKGNIYKLYNKKNKKEDSECIEYDELILKKNIKFDIMIVIPIINKTFDIKIFKKLIPHANVFNTFSVSEYNGEYPPYTFPIGVGKGNLGLLFNDFKIKQQKLIKKPYALVYIQPSPEWGVHSKTCFIAYLEMICKKYSKKHTNFDIIIPEWIINDINDNTVFFNRVKSILLKYYGNWNIIYSDGENVPLFESDKRSKINFRGDILPQPREIFISLMKDSIKDILVTGDQSLTDVYSCCRMKKTVWYQIAPWKKGLAHNLSKHLPNKYYTTFKTSCGTLKSIESDISWKGFLNEYDFRVKGKERMDSILIGSDILKKDKKNHRCLLDIIEKSRFLESAQNKINKLK